MLIPIFPGSDDDLELPSSLEIAIWVILTLVCAFINYIILSYIGSPLGSSVFFNIIMGGLEAIILLLLSLLFV